jgi:hypothetical protein
MQDPNTFDQNLLRVISAELYFLAGMQAAREMYTKGYFALGVVEKLAVDQAVEGMVASNFHRYTPQFFATPQPTPGPVGFAPPQSEKSG